MNHMPKQVQPILSEHLALLEAKLPSFLEAYYIFGSISLGAFHFGYSDIDFVAVTKNKATEEEIKALSSIHKNIKKKFPKTDLMGLYVTQQDLQSPNNNKESCPCFIDGAYKGLHKFDINSIDAFQLKKYGIAIKGPDPKHLEYTPDWNIIIQNMRHNLNTYWFNWMNSCKKPTSIRYIALYVSTKAIEWCVLGVTRQYYSFKEGDMISKTGAGEYALKNVPEQWHKIIHEALRLRKGEKKSYYKSLGQRRIEAIEYMDYIIHESNKIFQ